MIKYIEARTEPPEARVVCTCDECYDDILDGQRYYYLCGKVLCRGCVEDGERIAQAPVWPARTRREEYGEDY